MTEAPSLPPQEQVVGGDDLLFIYGTLRHDAATLPEGKEVAALLVRHSTALGAARLRGRLYRVADYPALVRDDAAGWVTGELIRLDEPEMLLPLLDTYEETGQGFPAPQEYVRVMADVEGPDGPVHAWVYEYGRNVNGLPLIASGDFLKQ
jgi:gamma-glutamylcyclotransferase (GGCT)/AIG2-like uncharacterized protein YtfP